MSTNGRRLALLVANSKYSDPKLGHLDSPVSDAERLRKQLESDACGNFEVTEFFDKPYDDVQDAIADFFEDARQSDLLVFFFSGHGLRDSDDRLFFGFGRSAESRPENRSISADYVVKHIDNSFADRVVTILDCCNAGLFANDGRKGVSRIGKGDFHPREMEGKGRYTLVSSTGKQPSQEGGGRSVYSKYLIEALSFGTDELAELPALTIALLQEHLFRSVKAELPGQEPNWWTSGTLGEIELARNPNFVLETDIEIPTQSRRDTTLRYRIPTLIVGAIISFSVALVLWPSADPELSVSTDDGKTQGEVDSPIQRRIPEKHPDFIEHYLSRRVEHLLSLKTEARDGLRGLNWSLKAKHRCAEHDGCLSGASIVELGADIFSDIQHGDAQITTERALLCSQRIDPVGRNKATKYEFALSRPLKLSSLTGKADADYVCIKEVGPKFLWHTKPTFSDNLTTGLIKGLGYRPELLRDLSMAYRTTLEPNARFWVHDRDSGAWPKGVTTTKTNEK